MPSFAYVICLKFNEFEIGKYQYTINIVEDDGKKIIKPYHNEISLENNMEQIIITNFQKIIFPHGGNYQIDFILNGDTVYSDPLILDIHQ